MSKLLRSTLHHAISSPVACVHENKEEKTLALRQIIDSSEITQFHSRKKHKRCVENTLADEADWKNCMNSDNRLLIQQTLCSALPLAAEADWKKEQGKATTRPS